MPQGLDIWDLRDRLAAVSHAIANGDNQKAQAVLGETLRMLAAPEAPAQADPTDPGHDVDVLREHVRHLERYIRQLHAAQPTQAEAPSGVTREDIEGARALMDMSEAEIDDELRRLGIDPDVAATKLGGFLCRLCGKDRPHAHSPEDVVIFRNGVKSATQPTQGEAPSEREGFEAWYLDKYANQDGLRRRHAISSDDYEFHHARDTWEGWQACRAALASQPQAEAVPVAVAQVEIVVPHLRSIVVKHIPGAPLPKVGDHLYPRAPTQASQPQAVDAEDAARLDWLDAQNLRFRMGWQVGKAPAGNVSVKGVIFAGTQPPVSIRAAIDAARRAGGAE